MFFQQRAALNLSRLFLRCCNLLLCHLSGFIPTTQGFFAFIFYKRFFLHVAGTRTSVSVTCYVEVVLQCEHQASQVAEIPLVKGYGIVV